MIQLHLLVCISGAPHGSGHNLQKAMWGMLSWTMVGRNGRSRSALAASGSGVGSRNLPEGRLN